MDQGEQISVQTGEVESMNSYEEFVEAYQKQMEYMIGLLVNADNSIDLAHAQRCPLPFLSCMVEDCIGRGISVQEGGAVYNFTGPQGFGIANMADALYVIKRLVFEEKRFTLKELKKALEMNFGQGIDPAMAEEVTKLIAKELLAGGHKLTEGEITEIYKKALTGGMSDVEQKHYETIYDLINEQPKFGNDIDEVDELAREVAYTYTKPMERYKNPRGGQYQAGLYPVSANVPLGAQTGATPDGRLARKPIADGSIPFLGKRYQRTDSSL